MVVFDYPLAIVVHCFHHDMQSGSINRFLLVLSASSILAITSAVAGTVQGSFALLPAGSNVDLTASGAIDWVDWGIYQYPGDYSSSLLNRKANVTPLISDFSTVGSPGLYDFVYQFTTSSNGYTWYDGQPSTAVTNTTDGVWVYQEFPSGMAYPLGSGFEFSVHADTNQRALSVYVGANAVGGKLVALLSDGGGYTNTSLYNGDVGPNAVYNLTFAANSSGQSLVVKWIVGSTNPTNSGGYVSLQAASLTSAGADNPPFILLTTPTNETTVPGGTDITFSGSAQEFDGTITNIAFFAGTNLLGQTTANPFSFVWTNPPVGHYMVSAVATDSGGAFRASTPTEVFVYGNGGSELASLGSPASPENLTADGTADWTHWGLSNAGSFDYKTNAARQISNFTIVGTNTVRQYANNATQFSWSDGTPDPAATNTPTGVFLYGDTNGFELTAPADTNSRTLQVYVGLYGAVGKFQAYLSDLSGPPFTDTSISNAYASSDGLYTITYSAASAGQTLKVIYTADTLLDATYGNVTLQSATLQGSSLALPVALSNPWWSADNFGFSFLSQPDHVYDVEYTASLSPVNWQILTSVPGTGGIINVTNQNPALSNCFYRVQTQ